jgi:hypothetical protein
MINMKQNQLKHARLNKCPVFLPLFCLGMMANSNSTYAMPVLNATWQYVNGTSGYEHTTGRPNTMTDESSSIPTDLLTTIQTLLPEGVSVSNNPKVLAMLANSEGANIKLKAPADITVSFVFEKADYQSSIGYFAFPKADLASLSVFNLKDTIIFPNFSDSILQYGDSVKLGSFQTDYIVGFTIAADGWVPFVSDLLSEGMVNPSQSPNNIFRTIKKLNPEMDNNLKDHTLVLAYPDKELMVVVFEDLNRETYTFNHYNILSDDDFNDAILIVHISPWSSVDCSNCNYIVPPSSPPPTTHFDGEAGQISWREITAPEVVADPVKAAKAAAKAAEENQ